MTFPIWEKIWMSFQTCICKKDCHIIFIYDIINVFSPMWNNLYQVWFWNVSALNPFAVTYQCLQNSSAILCSNNTFLRGILCRLLAPYFPSSSENSYHPVGRAVKSVKLELQRPRFKLLFNHEAVLDDSWNWFTHRHAVQKHLSI